MYNTNTCHLSNVDIKAASETTAQTFGTRALCVCVKAVLLVVHGNGLYCV